jgi:hypothetical protein
MINEVDKYFGGCPHCGASDGMTNVYSKHLFYCVAHKTMWSPGNNLFSGWKTETEKYQRKRWAEIGLDDFAEVEPVFNQVEIALAR